MPLTVEQKETCKAIVSIFETGRVRGDYGAVTVAKGDSGHLSYGIHQASLSSGNLHLLLKGYCEAAGAQFAADISPFLSRLQQRDPTLDGESGLQEAMREAGNDPVMMEEQERFFDSVFWIPATNAASKCKLDEPLAVAVVYDSHIHGHWLDLRDQTNKDVPVAADGKRDGHQWVQRYVQNRKTWLLGRPDPLPRTIYRMETFQTLITDGRWNLPLPLVVRKATINADTLTRVVPDAPVRASADDGPRVLQVMRPYLSGSDVRAVQSALATEGFPNSQDGIFGPATEALVRAFQKKKGLRPDGVVGPSTRAALES